MDVPENRRFLVPVCFLYLFAPPESSVPVPQVACLRGSRPALRDERLPLRPRPAPLDWRGAPLQHSPPQAAMREARLSSRSPVT
eukprot:4616385-Pyramimonas_sp.AAC.1